MEGAPIFEKKPVASDRPRDWKMLFAIDSPNGSEDLERTAARLAQAVFPQAGRPEALPDRVPDAVYLDAANRPRARAHDCFRSASERGVDLIVAPSHGNGGATRPRNGSFVESLILLSDIPVLTAGPRTRIPPAFRRILFPTDLQGESKRVLERLIPFARLTGAQLIVFHAAHVHTGFEVPLLEPHALAYEEGQRPPYWRRDHDKLRLLAESFVDHALVSGVRAEARFDFSGQALIDILQFLSRTGDYDLIAMPTRSGPISSYFNGAIRRRMIQLAACPLWFLHEAHAGQGRRESESESRRGFPLRAAS